MDGLYTNFKRLYAQWGVACSEPRIKKFMQGYETSNIPRWFKKIDDCGDLKPVLYRHVSQRNDVVGKKRKRSCAQIA
jgi:hypothetical protein